MAIPNIANVLIISLLFFLIFAIICVNFFKGKFSYCYNTNEGETETIISSLNGNSIKTKWDCIDNGSVWLEFDSNFDNVFLGILTLFEMSTTEGWVEVMYLGWATTDIDKQPVLRNNFWVPLFFIMFILFGSFFILNLFVGVVIGTFNNEKENIGKNFLLTTAQKEWIDAKMMILAAKPVESSTVRAKIYKNKLRGFLLRIVEHAYFEIFIMT